MMITLSELESELLEILQLYPDGIQEFQLLKELERTQRGVKGNSLSFDNNLDLYRAHFLLFHALYRLREYLFEQRIGSLTIDVLEIRLSPWHDEACGMPAVTDPISEYYLNLANLKQTTLKDVEDLLGSFWTHYFSYEKRSSALAVLDLEIDSSPEDIERRYRKLAMLHHPDRGGDMQDFQELQEAVMLLRQGR